MKFISKVALPDGEVRIKVSKSYFFGLITREYIYDSFDSSDVIKGFRKNFMCITDGQPVLDDKTFFILSSFDEYNK